MTLAPGQTVGGYRIVDQIGRGGMSAVFSAYQTGLSRYVAIKALPSFFADDPVLRERFQREAMAIASLRHPNIITVYDYGEVDGVPYLVMELVPGGTLAARLGVFLSPAESLELLRPIASALDYAHARGIIHRDIKPSNVLINEHGMPVLSDFGVAYMLATSERLTSTGVVVGTPDYMAPEQATAGQLSAATDVYALTVMLYEMLTGRVPFTSDSPLNVAIAHISTPPPLPRSKNPSLPEAVESVVLTGLAKRPTDRYQTAGELVAALERAARSTGSQIDLFAETIGAPVTVDAASSTIVAPEAVVATAPGLDRQSTEVMQLPNDASSVRPRQIRVAVLGVVGAVVVVAFAVVVLSRSVVPSAVAEPTPLVVQAIPTSAAAGVPTEPTATVLTLPGGVWQIFTLEGGSTLNLEQPWSVGVDAQGNVLVVEKFAHRLSKLSATGQQLGRWGSEGSGAGQLRAPSGLGIDRQGNVYVADTNNHRIQVFAADGRFVAQWGGEGNRAAQFEQPHGVAVDGAGNVYVADSGNNRIQVFTADGRSVAQWGGPGTGPVQFTEPRGVAVDSAGDIYVADTNNHRIQKLSRTGQSLAIWGGEGDQPGQLRFPEAVALDDRGSIYVADSRNHRVQRLTRQGEYSAMWGGQGTASGKFSSPEGVAIDSRGVLYVADTDNNRIQRINLGAS